ncbi:MAG: DUF5668 domain-containing protein [Candidatus Staskawiczbacteria bacterium]
MEKHYLTGGYLNMFFAIIFIAIGVALLLNAMGLFSGGFWGVFWGIIFLAIGIKMIRSKGCCPMCSGAWWKGRITDKMNEECCGCEHEHEEKPRNKKK